MRVLCTAERISMATYNTPLKSLIKKKKIATITIIPTQCGELTRKVSLVAAAIVIIHL